MSVRYVAVQWNRNKRIYDACIVSGILGYISLFFVAGKALFSERHAISNEILAMRALGTCAYLLLHIVLCIGPLARLDSRVLPLLYNRRHLGVATFIVAAIHGAIAIGFYHGFGVVNPLVSLFASNTNYLSITAFPFQTLGFGALIVLFLMAATSHDFWLKNLGSFAWKGLHMLVYPAYGLLVMHVALGILQTHQHPALAAIVVLGVAIVVTLHLVAGVREWRRDRRASTQSQDARTNVPAECVEESTWIDVGSVGELVEGRGSTITIGNRERIAIFRHDGCISATENVCAHQGGPLGEGKIIDGCITCPWHGWQYRVIDGKSPPPFSERIAKYRVRVVNQRIQVNPAPLAQGESVEPAPIQA